MTDGTGSTGFRHEALLYAGPDQFVECTLPFIERGLSDGEAILVAVGDDKIRRLRDALNGFVDRVVFANMADVGANPARIIPIWADFVSEHSAGGKSVRGIGEPIWADRSPAELVECQLHESLLNLAFAESAGFTLLCPYDTTSLTLDVIQEAMHSHPCATIDGESQASGSYEPSSWLAGPFDQPLPEPETATQLSFVHGDDLAQVRELVAGTATKSGLGPDRQSALVLSVHEAAVNSLTHGGGAGTLRVWMDGASLIFEIRDSGRISDPLIGRVRPSSSRLNGRGLWLIQQLADLAQVRSDAHGTTIRIHFTT